MRSCGDYTREPAVLYAARRQVIAELLALDLSPRMVLQTDPPDTPLFSEIARSMSAVGANPEQRSRINGREPPVASDGLFLEQLPAQPRAKSPWRR